MRTPCSNCAKLGSPYLNDALVGIGCTEDVVDDSDSEGEVLPTFRAPPAAMESALKNEYLDQHPWYHTE